MAETQAPEPSCGATRPCPDRGRRGGLRDWLMVFVASLALYAVTANRGAQWQDSGAFILQIVTGKVVGPLGLALSHPLHHWLGRLAVWPDLIEPCLAITLVSSLGAALAVANVFGCVRTLTGDIYAALFAAVSLALANTFWHLATVTEVYTLSAGLLAGECWCLAAYARDRQARHIYAALLLNGLGLGNHLQALLTAPVLAVVVLDALRRRRLSTAGLAVGCALWIVGSLPYSWLVLARLYQTGDFPGTMHSALFGSLFATRVLNVTLAPGLLAVSFGAVLYNFPNLLLPAALLGMVRGKAIGVPSLARRALLAGLILHACFALRYDVVDRHTFFLPIYVFLTIFAGMGAAAVSRWESARWRRHLDVAAVGLLLLTPLAYWSAASIARRFDLLGGIVYHKPYRDDYRYLLIPWSVVERSADRMSREAVELAGPRGLILVEDGVDRDAIRYRALRAGRDQVRMVAFYVRDPDLWWARFGQEFQEAVGQGRAIVLVPVDANEVRCSPPGGRWRRVGDLYVFEPLAPATGQTPPPGPR